jgi:hypothetical protein
MVTITAEQILDALIAISDDKIWASELASIYGKSRIDFWTLEPKKSASYRTSSYEIKVTRADFLRDSDDKQEFALKWSNRFWYVVPPGIVQVADVPAYAGLMEWDGARFSVKRKAPKREASSPDWSFIVSLLRSCGDVRRDTALFTSEIAMLRRLNERERTREKMRNKRFMARLTRQWSASSSPNPGGQGG